MIEIGRASCARRAARRARGRPRSPARAKPRVNVNLAPSELLNARPRAGGRAGARRDRPRPGVPRPRDHRGRRHAQPEEARATMRRLRGLGVSLALDDFGTGHSSLAHLREFPIDTLKIAKPFVSALHDGQANAAFVETIVQLAGTLDQGVVAEGVESAEQAAEVARLGCGYAQGYYFGAPLAGLGVSQYLSSPRLPAGWPPAPATKPLDLERPSPPRRPPAPRPASSTCARPRGSAARGRRRRRPRARVRIALGELGVAA